LTKSIHNACNAPRQPFGLENASAGPARRASGGRGCWSSPTPSSRQGPPESDELHRIDVDRRAGIASELGRTSRADEVAWTVRMGSRQWRRLESCGGRSCRDRQRRHRLPPRHHGMLNRPEDRCPSGPWTTIGCRVEERTPRKRGRLEASSPWESRFAWAGRPCWPTPLRAGSTPRPSLIEECSCASRLCPSKASAVANAPSGCSARSLRPHAV